jgi:ubiquinone/menaquinone biosynthesis C-methylase UbiE
MRLKEEKCMFTRNSMTKTKDRHFKTKKYYKLLEEFIELCEEAVQNGQPYLTVILCHELYRFLYPVEPYVNFINHNPIGFIVNHIQSLNTIAKTFSKVVTAYPLELDRFNSNNYNNITLEKKTSDLYTDLWEEFDLFTLTQESLRLLQGRIPDSIIKNDIVGKRVLDMGCGSGRYTIALAKVGAAEVIGVDFQNKSFARAKKYCKAHKLKVQFQEANVHKLPFRDSYFDFIFCNGVLHHTSSIEKGLEEIARVLKKSGKAFLYLYASGGIFWKTREALRNIFKKIPIAYTKMILRAIGVPQNRFIFCDTWYVPVETHTSKDQLRKILMANGFSYKKIIGSNPFDLDGAIRKGYPGANEMWGDGEHRYLLFKRNN